VTAAQIDCPPGLEAGSLFVRNRESDGGVLDPTRGDSPEYRFLVSKRTEVLGDVGNLLDLSSRPDEALSDGGWRTHLVASPAGR
jgi:hypothetical protein